MKREIKFRVWDKLNNQMLDVVSIIWENRTGLKMLSLCSIQDSNKKHDQTVVGVDKDNNAYELKLDETGVEIYEGDIVELLGVEIRKIVQVKFCGGCLTFENYTTKIPTIYFDDPRLKWREKMDKKVLKLRSET